MRWIKKKQEPKKLTFHRNSGGTWDDFSLEKGKKDVKNQLLLEQNNLCAYCTGPIKFNNMKVEHWESRFHKLSKQLDYTNLLAVCKGCCYPATGLSEHCDTSKKEKLIDLDPQNKAHITNISYTKATGEILSSNPQHKVEIDAILKLNIEPFKKIRKTKLSTFRMGLRTKYKGKKANYTKELKNKLSKNEPFDSIIISYLERKALR